MAGVGIIKCMWGFQISRIFKINKLRDWCHNFTDENLAKKTSIIWESYINSRLDIYQNYLIQANETILTSTLRGKSITEHKRE